MPLNTEVDYNNVVIKGTVELGVKGERGLRGFKGDQGPPVPVAHELGDDPDLAVSQKLLTDSIADMEQSNSNAVLEATHQAVLAGDSAVIAADQAGIAAIKAGEASSSAGEAAQGAQASSVSALDAGQHANTATEQAGIAAIKAGEASDSWAVAEQAATQATQASEASSASALEAQQSLTYTQGQAALAEQSAIKAKDSEIYSGQLLTQTESHADRAQAKAIESESSAVRSKASEVASAASAATAAAVVTGGTAALSPEPGKIPLADGEGKIDVNWLGADVAGLDGRLSAVEALTAVSSVTWDMATDTYTGSPKVTLVHKNMRRCVINNQAQVQYYLDEFDSTKKEDGTPADLSGADGQVVVEINPTYVRRSFVGSKMTTELTHAPLPGFKLHEAFSGGVLKHYIGAYQATVWSVAGGENLSGLNSDNNLPRIDLATDYLTSLPDSFAMVGVSRTNFRTLAQNGGYQLYDYWQWELLKTLFIAEFGNWNSQAVLGNGNVYGAYPAASNVQSDSPHTMNGRSNSLGNNSGSSATNPFVSYRGIENPWGNALQYVDGVNILERQLWVSNDETLYNDNDETGYIKLGAPLPTSGYIKEWQKIANGFLPAVTGDGAGAATFIGDYLYTTTGRRALRVGGLADLGALAGLCCATGNSTPSSSTRSLSARLSKKLRA